MTGQRDESDEDSKQLDGGSVVRFQETFTEHLQQRRSFTDSLDPGAESRSRMVDMVSRAMANMMPPPKIYTPSITRGLYAFNIQVPALQSMVAQSIAMPAFNAAIRNLTESFGAQYQTHWQKLFESLGNLRARIFPENWEDIVAPSVEVLETILIDEGIPLMWVPGPSVIEALIAADDASARRRVISSRWKGIVSDCEAALDAVDHPILLDERDFAFDCVDALRDGHVNPAQALTANLLDTVLLHLDEKSRRLVKTNKFKENGVKFSLDDYKLRTALTFAPVWCAHAKFKAEQKETIPRVFARHASVHAVSRKQYSRNNAVIGLMVVTSVLSFYDTQMLR